MSVAVLNTDAALTGKTLMAKEVSETITGVKTFDLDPSAPFVVTGGSAVVTNLDADKVDGADYSTSTFTPTIISSGGGSATYSLQGGVWVRLGIGVWFRIHITTATLGTLAAGNITVGTLPFASGGGFASWAAVSYFGGLVTSVSSLGAALNSGGTTISMTYIPAAGSGSHGLLTKADLGAVTDIVLGGFYTV